VYWDEKKGECGSEEEREEERGESNGFVSIIEVLEDKYGDE
jgi:hypothetical protein